MIRIHHLNHSRSTRIIWLMEELGAPYEIIPHRRDERTMRSPSSLEQAHPLGKAPVIEDGALLLSESGAIIEYLIATQGGLIATDCGRALAPPNGTPAWAEYLSWLHFAEGSAMMPLLVHLLGMLTGGLPAGLQGFVAPDIEKNLNYIAAAVAGGGFLLGEDFSGADIQMSYVIEVARMGKLLGDYPVLLDYLARLEERPAYQRAIERGGPVPLPLG